MSFERGTLAIRRYRATGGGERRLSAPEAVDLLSRNAFRGGLFGARKGENSGWVLSENLLETSFTLENTYFAPYLVFALRTDRKSLPSALMKALVAQEARKRLEASGLERLKPGALKDIREEIEGRFVPKVLPSVTVVEVSWNLLDDHVLLATSSQRAVDRVRKQFSATFSRALRPLEPVAVSLAGADGAGRAERLRVLGGSDYAGS